MQFGPHETGESCFTRTELSMNLAVPMKVTVHSSEMERAPPFFTWFIWRVKAIVSGQAFGRRCSVKLLAKCSTPCLKREDGEHEA